VRVHPEHLLVAVKALHSAVWLFFVGCIAAIPIAALTGRLVWAAVFSGLVWLECAVLMMNRGRCPLTDVAGRYTEQRSDNFDIYLPEWLARHNKTIFGTLFVFSQCLLIWEWWSG